MSLDCHPICDTSFCCFCFSQRSGNPGVQTPGREEPREPVFIPSETLTPSKRQAQAAQSCNPCAAAEHPASALVQLEENTHPSSTPVPQPPSKHTGNEHSFQHVFIYPAPTGFGAEAKKDTNS